MSHSYLYGIVEGASGAVLGFPGAGSASPVRMVESDGLACVVSDHGGGDLRTLPREELVRRLLAHQQVVERVMQDHTVLPVKFGTVLDNAQEVLDLLSQGRSEFAGALASIRDKVEIEVAATWDTSRILEEISRDEEVVCARQAIIRKGQPTVEDRLRLGEMVKACIDDRRDSYRERMVSFLRPRSVDVVPNALVSDEMVMNVAFLVERARQHEFDAAVHQLDEIFQNEIAFRVIGPLPPYSFSTVEITRLTPEQIEEARQALHLGEVLSGTEVRKAYRRLAAEEQRNRRPGDRTANGQFSRLRRASDLLLRYCRAQKDAKRSQRGVGASSRDGGCLFLIDIGRTRSDEVEPARFGGAARV